MLTSVVKGVEGGDSMRPLYKILVVTHLACFHNESLMKFQLINRKNSVIFSSFSAAFAVRIIIIVVSV